MANTPDGKGGDDRNRVNMTVRPATIRYLAQLKKLGLYGDDKTSVAFRLVEDGIRQALERGIIHPESEDDQG